MFLGKVHRGQFGTLDIFNRGVKLANGMDIEFAECRECGQVYDHRSGSGRYPRVCVKCGAEFVAVNLVGVRGDEAKRMLREMREARGKEAR